MPLPEHYLSDLSTLFVQDLRRSEYYQNLSEDRRTQLEDRIQCELSQGLHPLLPCAGEADLENLCHAVEQELHVSLPSSVREVLQQVDGFSENGVTLYGIDPELREDQFESGPGFLAENKMIWSAFPETATRYLFLGETDLWYFAFDLLSLRAVALDGSNLTANHYFSNVEEMVTDMMRQALGDFDHPDRAQ